MIADLIGSAYKLDAETIENQRCLNWYPQFAEQGGGKNALIPCDGLILKHTLDGPVIAMRALSNGWILAATTTSVWRFNNAQAVLIGPIDPATTGSIADNGQTAIIGTDTATYAVTLSEWVLSKVDEEPRPNLDFIDGYFVYAKPDTGQFAWFKLYSTDSDPLNFATAEGDPDDIVGLKVVGREMWAIGVNSTEVYYNSGNQDLPFVRVGGAFLDIGCEAPQTVQKLGESLVFIASTEAGGRQVAWVKNGTYQGNRISTHAIENALKDADLSQASAFTYQSNGHGFYMLSLPSLNTTFCFDLNTGLWHERAHLDPITGILQRHRAQEHAYLDGVNFVSDYADGRIYEITSKAYTDAGVPVYRERTLPILRSESRRVGYDRFEVVVNNSSDQMESIELSWSDNYGRSFGEKRAVNLGRATTGPVRCVWRRLGSARHRIFKISTTAKQNVALTEAYIQLKEFDR